MRNVKAQDEKMICYIRRILKSNASQSVKKYGYPPWCASTLLIEGSRCPSFSVLTCRKSCIRDIMQQTDKVNGMQAVKFVELGRGWYTRNAHVYRIETVKEMDRWIKGDCEKRREEEGKGGARNRRWKTMWSVFTQHLLTR